MANTTTIPSIVVQAGSTNTSPETEAGVSEGSLPNSFNMDSREDSLSRREENARSSRSGRTLTAQQKVVVDDHVVEAEVAGSNARPPYNRPAFYEAAGSEERASLEGEEELEEAEDAIEEDNDYEDASGEGRCGRGMDPTRSRSLDLPSSSSPRRCDGQGTPVLRKTNSLQRNKSQRVRLLVRSHAMREATSPPPEVDPAPSSAATGAKNGSSSARSMRFKAQGNSAGSLTSMESSTTNTSLSRDSSTEQYTDSTGIDLHQFIIETLHRSQKDRIMVLRIEGELVNFIKDTKRPHFKFPAMSSYHRMLVHRIAAYFGLEHNIDQTGAAVVVNRGPATRLPEFRFKELIREDEVIPEEPKRLLRRECASLEEYGIRSPDGSMDRRVRSFEDREEEFRGGTVVFGARVYPHPQHVHQAMVGECPSGSMDLLDSPMATRGGSPRSPSQDGVAHWGEPCVGSNQAPLYHMPGITPSERAMQRVQGYSTPLKPTLLNKLVSTAFIPDRPTLLNKLVSTAFIPDRPALLNKLVSTPFIPDRPTLLNKLVSTPFIPDRPTLLNKLVSTPFIPDRPTLLNKVRSFETTRDNLAPSNGSGGTSKRNPAVSKSNSFGGYTGKGGSLSREDSLLSTHSAEARLFITKQDSLASTVSRLSAASSGYKSGGYRSSTDVPTPSPGTGPAGMDGMSFPSVAGPSPPILSSSDTVIWVASSLDVVPIGAVLINPLTGQPYLCSDGSIYHFDPGNPPLIKEPSNPRPQGVEGKGSGSLEEYPNAPTEGAGQPLKFYAHPASPSVPVTCAVAFSGGNPQASAQDPSSAGSGGVLLPATATPYLVAPAAASHPHQPVEYGVLASVPSGSSAGADYQGHQFPSSYADAYSLYHQNATHSWGANPAASPYSAPLTSSKYPTNAGASPATHGIQHTPMLIPSGGTPSGVPIYYVPHAAAPTEASSSGTGQKPGSYSLTPIPAGTPGVDAGSTGVYNTQGLVTYSVFLPGPHGHSAGGVYFGQTHAGAGGYSVIPSGSGEHSCLSAVPGPGQPLYGHSSTFVHPGPSTATGYSMSANAPAFYPTSGLIPGETVAVSSASYNPPTPPTSGYYAATSTQSFPITTGISTQQESSPSSYSQQHMQPKRPNSIQSKMLLVAVLRGGIFAPSSRHPSGAGMTLVAETGIEDGTIWQPPVGVFAPICIDLVRASAPSSQRPGAQIEHGIGPTVSGCGSGGTRSSLVIPALCMKRTADDRTDPTDPPHTSRALNAGPRRPGSYPPSSTSSSPSSEFASIRQLTKLTNSTHTRYHAFANRVISAQ
ncbi:unnamed protein product [Cyprideis torosa]|uniref:Uncharacterized protein n=1 Tax=Cyprideis torosa TaxID=163714 RepID=A0A7R8W6X2_9CRUS|nr:unnamed protein product [Cyprideis torosa]CAG0886954.1 unnamed protein product [Cyprideis torosa]